MGRKIKDKIAEAVHETVRKGTSKLKHFKVSEQLVDVTGAKGESVEWEGQDITTESSPLLDGGEGKEVVLRRFDFALPPLPKEQLPTKEKLLEFHKSKVIAFLWKDELNPISDREPFKIVMSKNGQNFRIFALCEARKGSRILEKPKLIQEAINGRQEHTD